MGSLWLRAVRLRVPPCTLVPVTTSSSYRYCTPAHSYQTGHDGTLLASLLLYIAPSHPLAALRPRPFLPSRRRPFGPLRPSWLRFHHSSFHHHHLLACAIFFFLQPRRLPLHLRDRPRLHFGIPRSIQLPLLSLTSSPLLLRLATNASVGHVPCHLFAN